MVSMPLIAVRVSDPSLQRGWHALSSVPRKKKKSDVPSEFSIIRGVFPSMTATAELVVPMRCQFQDLCISILKRRSILPKSIPMTAPLTFSSPPFD